MNTLRKTPDLASELVADGVKLFHIHDYDGVWNSMYRNGKFPKQYFNSDKRIHYPNPHYTPRVRNTWVDPYAPKEPKSFELAWSNELVQNFNKVAADSRVQLVILSTWREQLGGVLDRMNIKTAREPLYLPWSGRQMHDQFYKARALRYFLWEVNKGSVPEDPNAYMVWLDDVVLHKSRPSYRDGLPAPEFTPSNSLLIAPNENYGISRAEWAEIAEFSTKALA